MKPREVSRKALDVQPSAIHRMSALAAKTPGAVALSWARPDADTPGHINEAAIRAIRDGMASRYSPPPGLPALREAIAEKLSSYNGIEANPAEVLVTTGAAEGLFAAVLALLDPGDEVLMPSPNYMTHELMVRMASAVPVYFPTVEEEGWRLDLDALERSITPKTKLILFCNPCNPTGAFSYRRPRGSYTMFPRIEAEGGGDSAEFCLRVLSEAKVAMTPGSPFGPQGEGHARLCFCSSAETINEAFDRLDAYFGG